MAVTNATVRTFKTAAKYSTDGTFDLDAASAFKLLLMGSGYAFSSASSAWSQISASERASANGYARGGSAISSVTYSSVGTSGFIVKAGNRAWTASGNLSAYGAIIRHQSSLKLLAYVDFGGAVVAASGEPLTVNLSEGYLRLGRA